MSAKSLGSVRRGSLEFERVTLPCPHVYVAKSGSNWTVWHSHTSHLLRLAFPSHPRPQGPLHPVIPYLHPESSLFRIPSFHKHLSIACEVPGSALGKLTVNPTEAHISILGPLLLPVGGKPWRQLPNQLKPLQRGRPEETGVPPARQPGPVQGWDRFAQEATLRS